MKKVPSKGGFTLIELVLVTAILAVIGMAVYGTFLNGINIWKKVTEDSVAEDINLFFEKISFDLRNSFKLTGMRFKGEETRVSFPSTIKYSGRDGIENTIGEITYTIDRRKKTLIRREASYSEVYHKKPGPKRILSENVSSLQFKYYVYEEKYKRYSWVTHWQEKDETLGMQAEERLPLIVKIEIGIPIPNEKGEQTFVRTVRLPAGCCWPYSIEEQ